MTQEKQGASFNPDDASGLFDNARAVISAVKVDYFDAKTGSKYLNVDITFKPAAGEPITEHFLLGGADQWAPNASKTGAIPVTEGGRIWNKSQVYRFMKSLADQGFPKNRLGNDLSVLVGTDVHVTRVTDEGQKYTDKNGKERDRTTLLVTKIYALPGEKAGKNTGTVPTQAGGSTAANAPPTTADYDDYTRDVLVRVLENDGDVLKLGQGKRPDAIAIEKIPGAAFVLITRDKKALIRQAVQARMTSEAFLAGLAEQGLVEFDGKQVKLTA